MGCHQNPWEPHDYYFMLKARLLEANHAQVGHWPVDTTSCVIRPELYTLNIVAHITANRYPVRSDHQLLTQEP